MSHLQIHRRLACVDPVGLWPIHEDPARCESVSRSLLRVMDCFTGLFRHACIPDASEVCHVSRSLLSVTRLFIWLFWHAYLCSVGMRAWRMPANTDTSVLTVLNCRVVE